MLALLVIIFPDSYALADDLAIRGTSCVLMDGDSGEILYQQNPDAKCYPASVTKIMTMVLTLEAVNDGKISLDDQVTTSAEAASMGGSQVYLYEGEVRSVKEMLIAVAVGSGNDASVALAEHVSGSLPAFVDQMNKKANELGMTGTNFANPHGLHDANHYTTAADMAKLAYYAIRVPTLLDYTSIYEYDFRPDPKPLKLWNTNRLLKWYDGCDGLKTGYTPEANRNLVSTAERNGLRLISVVLGVPEAKGHFTESMKLLNYGFNQFSYEILYDAGAEVTNIKVSKGSQETVGLIAKEKVGALKKKGEEGNLTVRINCPSYVKAPLKKGDEVGEIVLYKSDTEVKKIALIVSEDVNKGSFLRLLRKIFWQMSLMSYPKLVA